MMQSNTAPKIPFAKLARRYLATLEDLRDAKTALGIAGRIGHDVRDLQYHAAQAQVTHQEAFVALVRAAIVMAPHVEDAA